MNKPPNKDLAEPLEHDKTAPRPHCAPNSPLLVILEARFDETGHPEPWRNDLARELNLLLTLAAQYGPTQVGETILSVIRRVSQFEEIQLKS